MPITSTNGVTYLRMADSVTPADLPAGMDAYAGYANGNWADYLAIAQMFPGAYLLDLTVFYADVGGGGDFELGDMGPADAVPYVTERHAAGVVDPVCYASIDGDMIDIVSNLVAAGFARPSYRLFSAHYGWPGQIPGLAVGQHICGPGTCGSPIQCDATQWVDHGPWDESLLSAVFFTSLTPVITPPPPLKDDDMQLYMTNSTGTGFIVDADLSGKTGLVQNVAAPLIASGAYAVVKQGAVDPTTWDAFIDAIPLRENA